MKRLFLAFLGIFLTLSLSSCFLVFPKGVTDIAHVSTVLSVEEEATTETETAEIQTLKLSENILNYTHTLFDDDNNKISDLELIIPQFEHPKYENEVAEINTFFLDYFNNEKRTLEEMHGDIIEQYMDMGKISGGYFKTNFAYTFQFDKYLTVNICYDSYWSGAIHNFGYETSYVFDITSGKAVGLKDIFVGDETEFRKRICKELYYELDKLNIFEHILGSIQNDEETKTEFVFNTCNEFVTDKSFILEQDGIRFVFDPYEIASYSAGTIVVIIPYEKLSDVMINIQD